MGALGNLCGGNYTDIRRKDAERRCTGASECKTRQATPEELERYFGKPGQKDKRMQVQRHQGAGSMTAQEELMDYIQKMTREEWNVLMTDDSLGEDIIELLKIIGRQRGWLS